MQSRNQYLEALIRQYGGYHLKSKKEKSKLLDEYCKVVKQNRKYVIRKLRTGAWVYQEKRKQQPKQRKRKSYYDDRVKSALIKCWNIFDQPCGQRLAPLLKQETDRLLKLNELSCSLETVAKLKQIGSRTIDEKLSSHKEKEKLKRYYCYKNNPLLYQKIPVKLSMEWPRNKIGNIQIDLVEHCGQSAYGDFIYTLSSTDIATGWWEGGAQLNKAMRKTVNNLKKIKAHYPFDWKAIHSDNDSTFINDQLYDYALQQELEFTRSRPYHKNDNCFVEQKNCTHVRRCVGHYRYDTKKELALLNDLYFNELRLYKNFFQPMIKLISKERISGHIKRIYDQAKTPYQRILENPKVSKDIKQKLQKTYCSLNPAKLKRSIDQKLKLLKQLYDAKQQCPETKKYPTNNLKYGYLSKLHNQSLSVT